MLFLFLRLKTARLFPSSIAFIHLFFLVVNDTCSRVLPASLTDVEVDRIIEADQLPSHPNATIRHLFNIIVEDEKRTTLARISDLQEHLHRLQTLSDASANVPDDN